MNGSEGGGHHTAMTGFLGEPLAVALILHFLERQGGQARCVTTKVTQGTVSGVRLDAWIAHEQEGRRTLYQTEIKMWAGNAFGGLRLAMDAGEDVLTAGAARQWARVWDTQRQNFVSPVVGKVLIRMKLPPGYDESWRVEPLACFWWLMRSEPQNLSPWFTVPVGEEAASSFQRVHIFSLTAYLLSLNDETLYLHMPLLRQRLEWLGRLLSPPGRHWTETFHALSRIYDDFEPEIRASGTRED